MLEDATILFGGCDIDATRQGYREAIMEQNCLGKRTVSTRRASDQRLGELYSLDPKIILFRVMRLLWLNDERGRPILALLLALARDPLLRLSADPVLRTAPGEQLTRQHFTEAIARGTGTRFKAEILDKIVRNTASSWTQSGHLQGRTHKVRRSVVPTPAAITFALLESFLLGTRGEALFQTLFTRLLDVPSSALINLAQDAKRLGFLDMRMSGNVIEVTFPNLLSEDERRIVYGKN